MQLAASDRGVLDEVARLGLEIVELDHARQRSTGKLGVVVREGHVIALSAHRCGLTSAPEGFLQLPSLQRLDVGGNPMRELPSLEGLPSLRQLYVYDSQIERLPPLPALEVLDANRAALAELQPLGDVAFVYVAENRLRHVPPTRGARYLNVSGNPLESFAVEDGELRELRAEKCKLTALPPAIAELVALRELSLRDNALTALPEELGALSALEVLDLRGNALDDLPRALLDLSALRKLDLRWNPLRQRPAWLAELEARGCAVYV